MGLLHLWQKQVNHYAKWKNTNIYFLLFVEVNRDSIRMVWLCNHWVFSYKCCFATPRNVNDSILFSSGRNGWGENLEDSGVQVVFCPEFGCCLGVRSEDKTKLSYLYISWSVYCILTKSLNSSNFKMKSILLKRFMDFKDFCTKIKISVHF